MHNFRFLTIIVSSISLFFSFMNQIIIFYHKAHSKLRFEIVTYLNIICMITNINMLLPYREIKEDPDPTPPTMMDSFYLNEYVPIDTICSFQSFINAWTEGCKIGLASILAYCCYLACLKLDYLEKNIEKFRFVFISFLFIFSLPMPLM